MKKRAARRRTSLRWMFGVALILTLAAGWMLTGFLGRVAEKAFQERVNRDAGAIGAFLHESLGDVANAAKSLSGADQAVDALSTGTPTDLGRANRLLDRVNSSLDLSVSYLLDRTGLTVASSNRNEKNSFVGKSFAFRPFVKGALSGRPVTYFALGQITHERGFFATVPVVDSRGTILGVVCTKRDTAAAETLLSKYKQAYLVSPEGIIFISSRQDLLNRSLWPIAEKRRAELLASQQFGKVSFEPLLAAEPRDGSYVTVDNSELYLKRLPIGHDGWTLVMMEQPEIVSNYRWFGILLTTVFAVMLLFFFTVLRYKNMSLEVARDLLKARDDWKRTFDSMPDLIAIIDTNCRITNMNRAMAERLGISPAAAVGRHCYELLHGTQAPPASCPHRKMTDSGKTESVSMFEKNLDSEFIVTASPLLAEDGSIESSVHVMHDVSELKRLELSLKEYAERLEFVLEGSRDATWEWDILADQAVLNTRYYELMEYAPEETELNYATFLKSIDPHDAADVQRRFQEHLDGKTGEFEAQFRMVTRSGKVRDVIMRGRVVRRAADGRPTRMAGVTTDITEHKRLSDEVNRIGNLESIALLAGGLAHDFNNILNIIYGNISFVKMLAGDDSAFIEPLRDAEEACERAKGLGLRLQALSQGSAPLKEPLALCAIMEEVAAATFKGSDISHTISAAGDLYPLEADPRQIRQVFEGLLTNAHEALSAGGTVRIDIDNYLADGNKGLPLGSGRYLRIAIQDDGPGIPQEHLPRIFDPYFSTKDTYSHRGLGLGLSTCHAILKRHRGHISVESTVGTGTLVTLYLPASVEESIAPPQGVSMP